MVSEGIGRSLAKRGFMAIEIKELTKFSLLRGITAEHVDRFLAALVTRSVPAGTVLFEQGQPALGFYLIREGSVKIFKMNQEGREQVLGVFQDGDSFAEAAVFQGFDYPASAQCLKDSQLLFVSREALLREIQRNPELAFRLLAGLSMKLRSMVSLVEDLTLRDARGRLSRYITTLLPHPLPDEPLEFSFPFSQTVLARMLGIASETLSRTLKGLCEENVLEHQSNRWLVIRPDLLGDVAA